MTTDDMTAHDVTFFVSVNKLNIYLNKISLHLFGKDVVVAQKKVLVLIPPLV
jgi:hypothetical protein